MQVGTTLRTLATDVNLPNATFSQKLPEFLAVTSTSYLWHAVSVQTSSGTILGCGRLETLFSVEGSYNKSNTFSQFSPFLPASLKDVSNIDILKHNILDGISGTCSKKSAIFDPWSPPIRQVGTITTADQFPVGDLPNHVLEVLSLLPEVPLIGSATILGHVVRHGLHIHIWIILTQITVEWLYMSFIYYIIIMYNIMNSCFLRMVFIHNYVYHNVIIMTSCLTIIKKRSFSVIVSSYDF